MNNMRRVLLLFILGMFVFLIAHPIDVSAFCAESNGTCDLGGLRGKISGKKSDGNLIISVDGAPSHSSNTTLCVGVDIDVNGTVLEGTTLKNITIDSEGNSDKVNMGVVDGGSYEVKIYTGNVAGYAASETQILCGRETIIVDGPTATPTPTPADPNCLSLGKNSKCLPNSVMDGTQILCYPEREVCDQTTGTVIRNTIIADEDWKKFINKFYQSDNLGTYGNACWMRREVLGKDSLIPKIAPGIDFILNPINSIVKSLINPVNVIATQAEKFSRQDQICKGSVPRLRDNTGRFIGEKEDDYNILERYYNSIHESWESGDWSKFETGIYSKYDCQCLGEEDPISEYPEGVIPPVEGGENVEGAAVSIHSINAKVISSEVCLNVIDGPISCLPVECSKTLIEGEAGECLDCLLQKNRAYISGGFSSIPSEKCVSLAAGNLCKPLIGLDKEDELKKCIDCISNKEGMWTAIGCMYTDLEKTINEQLFGLLIGFGGVSVLGCIIFAAFRMQTSAGNPEQVKAAQDMATSCIIGLIIIIFSVFILRVIGVDILRIPFLS